MSVDDVDYGNSITRRQRALKSSKNNTASWNEQDGDRTRDNAKTSSVVPQTTPKFKQRAFSENPRMHSYMNESMTSSYRAQKMNLGVQRINVPYHGPQVQPTWRNWREVHPDLELENQMRSRSRSEYLGTNPEEEPKLPPYSSTMPRLQTPAVKTTDDEPKYPPYSSTMPRLQTPKTSEATSKNPDKPIIASNTKKNVDNKRKNSKKTTPETNPDQPPSTKANGRQTSVKKPENRKSRIKCSIM